MWLVSQRKSPCLGPFQPASGAGPRYLRATLPLRIARHRNSCSALARHGIHQARIEVGGRGVGVALLVPNLSADFWGGRPDEPCVLHFGRVRRGTCATRRRCSRSPTRTPVAACFGRPEPECTFAWPVAISGPSIRRVSERPVSQGAGDRTGWASGRPGLRDFLSRREVTAVVVQVERAGPWPFLLGPRLATCETRRCADLPGAYRLDRSQAPHRRTLSGRERQRSRFPLAPRAAPPAQVAAHLRIPTGQERTARRLCTRSRLASPASLRRPVEVPAVTAPQAWWRCDRGTDLRRRRWAHDDARPSRHANSQWRCRMWGCSCRNTIKFVERVARLMRIPAVRHRRHLLLPPPLPGPAAPMSG